MDQSKRSPLFPLDGNSTITCNDFDVNMSYLKIPLSEKLKVFYEHYAD